MKKYLVICLKYTLIVSTCVLILPNQIFAASSPQSATVQNDVFIGEFQFTLYGYTSPRAKVIIDGMGIHDETYADENGHYIFKNRFSPFSPREACITSQDQFGRSTQATCLPPFPTKYNVTIGPVLLPPTISFNKQIYYINDKVVLSGQTIPNTHVSMSVFQDKYKLLQILSPASSFFPKVEITSDKKGNFSVTLPSKESNAFRLFTQALYGGSLTPKSNTLHFDIYPIWMIIISFFIFIWELIRPRIIELMILLELTAVTYYIYRRFHHPKHIRALMLRPHFEIEVPHEERAIVAIEHKS